jgi:hypothetical protein
MIIWDNDTDASTPTAAETIVLRKGADVWYADFALTRLAPRYRQAWQTAMVATPFPITTPSADVWTAIKARNPEYVIYVAN